jgi:hypothetical protein
VTKSVYELFGDGEIVPQDVAECLEMMRDEHSGGDNECPGDNCWVCHWLEVLECFQNDRPTLPSIPPRAP